MSLPPSEGPSASDDAFDFSRSARQQTSELLSRLIANAHTTPQTALERRHLAIAMTAVGATWFAPMIAARRRRKRKRAT